MNSCLGNCNQGRRCNCATPRKLIAIQRAKNAKKLLADFIYYLRQGLGIRAAWRLAKVTL